MACKSGRYACRRLGICRVRGLIMKKATLSQPMADEDISITFESSEVGKSYRIECVGDKL